MRWLATPRRWSDLQSDLYLKPLQVGATPINGAKLAPDGAVLTQETGVAQISYAGNPRSLLFVYGTYIYANSTSTYSYDKISPEYFRAEISPLTYEPDVVSLDGVWRTLDRLEKGSATKVELEAIRAELVIIESILDRQRRRADPLDVVQPSLSALYQELYAKTRDLQLQLDRAQIIEGTTLPNSSFYTKAEADLLLSGKASKGELDTLETGLLPTVDFDEHALARNPHNTRHTDVGAASAIEFATLSARVAGLGRDEEQFFWGGSLPRTSFVGMGFWYPWGPIEILAVRASVGTSPLGGPLIVDVKRNGTTIFANPGDRPTIPDGERTFVSTLGVPYDMTSGERLSVDLVQTGVDSPGSNLLVQVLYAFDV